MTTAILYARYSTHMQSQASIEDQLRLLRDRASREGWDVGGEHADRAISGTVRARPGLNAALAQLQPGMVLLAEALDRISRDQEDLARIYKQSRFIGARIVTLSEGEVGTIHIGMGSTMSAVFLEQLGEKTRRGQIGRVKAGRVPGGLSYGYRVVRELGEDGEIERGLRAVREDQAAIVRRIFAEYAAGQSTAAICRALNAEAIPSPEGKAWMPNTISGNRRRRTGILNNPLYRGIILYNRQSFRKDPLTRKRVARATAEADHHYGEVPQLRIVSEDQWHAVQARLGTLSAAPLHQRRRPKRLLSGLLICGECDRPWTILTLETWGCAHARKSGTCGCRATISTAEAERRVWAAISGHLLHPDVIAAYVDEFRLAMADARRAQIRERAGLDQRIAALEAEEERVVDAIVAGLAPEKLKARSHDLAQERARLIIERDQGAGDELPIMHPALVDGYRERVQRIAILANSDEATRAEGYAIIRELIERITATPKSTGERGADLVLHGQLAAFLTNEKGRPNEGGLSGSNGPTVSMVAGARVHQCSGLIRIAA